MVAADEEDKGTDKEDKANQEDMVNPWRGWAPREGGHNSNNLEAAAEDAEDYAAADVAVDEAEDAAVDEETDMPTGSN